MACARISQNFLSKNTRSGPPSLAAARAWSHSDAMARLGVTQAQLAQHEKLTVTRVTVTRHAQRQARLTRPGPSHSPRPAVHHSPQPASLAAARVTRCGPPSLATASLNRRGTVTRPSHSDGAAARLCSPQLASLTQ